MANPGTPPWTESEQDDTPTSDWIGGYSNDANYKVDPFMVWYEDWSGVNRNVLSTGTGSWYHFYGKDPENFSNGQRYELPDMLVRLKPSTLNSATGGNPYSQDYRNPSTLDKFNTGAGGWFDANENTSGNPYGNWWDGSWSKRRKITFDNLTQTENLAGFPVLIKIDSSRIDYAQTQNQGQDIRFVDDDGTTLLSHEIEEWNEAGTSCVWVKVPQIDGSSDTDFIWMYYGNPSAPDGQDRNAVWDSNFKGVWHLKESGTGTANEFNDSTSNNNHGQGGKGYSGYTPTQSAGQIGYGQTFDGVNDFIDMASSGWSDSAWPYRKRIVIQGSQVSGTSDLSNFPVLIKFLPDSDTNLKHTSYGGHVGKDDGTDIFFTNDEGGKCDHEIEKYDPETGELVAWVEAPVLHHSANTTLYMYYGNASAIDQQNVNGTWDANSDFKAVWHLHNDFLDSTPNSYNGTNFGSSDATGKIADAQQFDGIDDYVDLSVMNPQSYNDFTISAWYKSTDASVSDDEYMFAHMQEYGGVGEKGPGVILSATEDSGETDHLRLSIYDASQTFHPYYGTSDIVDQQYHFVVAVRESGRIKLYVDGVKETDVVDLDAGETISIAAPPEGPFIGDWPGDTEQVHGILDEVRISNIARSADWIATEHNNQSDPSGFYQVLGEETPSDITLDLTGTQITLEAWVNYNAAGTGHTGALTKNGFANGYRLTLPEGSPPKNANFQLQSETGGNLTSAGTLSAGTWYYIAGTWDGDSDSTMRIYIDGGPDTNTQSKTPPLVSASKEFWIGHGDHAIEKAWSYPWYGDLDEVRISTIARSANWIAAQHKSMMDTFATYGEEESSDFFNEAEGCYSIEMADNDKLAFDIHGITYERYSPAFKIRNYRSLDDPKTVYRDGTKLEKGADYNAAVIPFSEAWYFTWWDSSYAYRKKITVSAGSESVPSGYSASVTFDHAALVNAVPSSKSLASGDDIRIARWDGSTWTELDRVLDPLSSWNDGSTKIWFSLVDPISASSSDSSYYLYYGNISASGPPDDWANVFMVGDDFNDGTLTSGMTTSTAGAASITETGGEAVIDLGTDENADAGILVTTNALPDDKKFVIRHKTKLVSGGGVNYAPAEVKAIGISQYNTRPTVADSSIEGTRRRIVALHFVDDQAWIQYNPDAHGGSQQASWDGTTWALSTWAKWGDLSLDTYYIYDLISNGTNWYVRVSDANGSEITTTTPVAWSIIEDYDPGDPFWFYLGEVYTNAYYADQKSDWVYVRKYVDSEPSASAGNEETNGSPDPVTQLGAGGFTSSSSESLASANSNRSLPFASGEYLYLGSTSKFTGVNIDLEQAGAGGTLSWQYWNGAWANLSNVQGPAKEFTASGYVHFDQPSDWQKTSVNGGTSLYYVRAYLASGSYTTAPVESLVKT
ncbi:MAG: hypothetical protein AMJ46_14510, partial [Latescibacteria bacterium DG_63]